MSSRWNRPMRLYRPPGLVCQTCGQPVQVGRAFSFAAWEHVRRLKVSEWHQAVPA